MHVTCAKGTRQWALYKSQMADLKFQIPEANYNDPSKLARLSSLPVSVPPPPLKRGGKPCSALHMLLQSSLVSLSGKGTRCWSDCALERGPSEGARSGSKGPARVTFLYVSIISNLASNSCPQDMHRMQSDSTVNSSDLMPIPPQSGQRARCTR